MSQSVDTLSRFNEANKHGEHPVALTTSDSEDWKAALRTTKSLDAEPIITEEPMSSTVMRHTNASATESAGFFKLPRELRDQVYDLLYEDYKSEEFRGDHGMSCWNNTYVCKTRHPLAKARLISRQLKAEFEERMPLERYLGSLPFPELRSPLHRHVLRSHMAVKCTELLCTVNVDWDERCLWCATSTEFSAERIGRIARVVRHMPYIEDVRILLDTKAYTQSLGCNLRFRRCDFGEYVLNGMLTAMSESGLVGPQKPASLRRVEVTWVGEDMRSNGRLHELCTWSEADGLHVYIEAAKQCGKRIVQVEHGKSSMIPLTVHNEDLRRWSEA